MKGEMNIIINPTPKHEWKSIGNKYKCNGKYVFIFWQKSVANSGRTRISYNSQVSDLLQSGFINPTIFPQNQLSYLLQMITLWSQHPYLLQFFWIQKFISPTIRFLYFLLLGGIIQNSNQLVTLIVWSRTRKKMSHYTLGWALFWQLWKSTSRT